MLPSVGKQITWLPSPRGAVTKGELREFLSKETSCGPHFWSH